MLGYSVLFLNSLFSSAFSTCIHFINTHNIHSVYCIYTLSTSCPSVQILLRGLVSVDLHPSVHTIQSITLSTLSSMIFVFPVYRMCIPILSTRHSIHIVYIGSTLPLMFTILMLSSVLSIHNVHFVFSPVSTLFFLQSDVHIRTKTIRQNHKTGKK